jgi:hypothetical protein
MAERFDHECYVTRLWAGVNKEEKHWVAFEYNQIAGIFSVASAMGHSDYSQHLEGRTRPTPPFQRPRALKSKRGWGVWPS